MAFAYKPPHSKTWRIGFRDCLTKRLTSVSAKTTREQEARKKAKDLTAEHRLKIRKSNLVKPGDHKFILSEAFRLYCTQKNIKPKTIKGYQLALLHFYAVAGNKPLYQYSKFDYFKLIEMLNARKISKNSRANYTRHLFALFNWFAENKFIENNFIVRTPEQRKEPEPIPLDELDKIFLYLKNNGRIKDFNLVKLIYLVAFRTGEFIESRAEDFDFKNGIVYIRNSKGDRTDKLPMLEDIKEHLQGIIKQDIGRYHHFTTYTALRSFWQRIVYKLNMKPTKRSKNDKLNKKYKIKKIYTLHQLRKTRGTDLAERSVNPFFLQKFMRHTSIRTTEQYYININLDKARIAINEKLKDNP